MERVFNSFVSWLKEKTTSSILFTYICFSVLWNWRALFVLFAEDAELLNKPRLEYIPLAADSLASWLLGAFLHFLPPALITFLFVKYFKHVECWAHKIKIEEYFSSLSRFEDAQAAHEIKKTQILKTTADERIKQKNEIEKIEKASTAEQILEDDARKFAEDEDNIRALYQAKRSIYTAGGRFVTSDFKGNNLPFVDSDSLARLDAHELILFMKEEFSDVQKIALTQRGKYFLKFLLSDDKYKEVERRMDVPF